MFHLLLLGSAIFVNNKADDFEFLIKLRDHMSWMTYAGIFGLILFIVNMMIASMDKRNRQKEKIALEQEANSYKAKMFDLQEATKSVITESKSSTDVIDSDNSPIE